MTSVALATGSGPLSATTDGVLVPPPDGPTAFVQPYPRRVRAVLHGVTVVDTEGAAMLHAPGRLAALWVPRTHVRLDLLGEVEPREPEDDAVGAALGDRVQLPFGRFDRWFAEDEPVYAHFKDPYHRVDVLTSSRHVVVTVGGATIAESRRPRLLFETGLPVRYYLPWADVDLGAVVRSDTVSECPYKGDGQHWHVETGGARVEDAAWSLPHPLPEACTALEHVAFYPSKVELVVDGTRVTD